MAVKQCQICPTMGHELSPQDMCFFAERLVHKDSEIIIGASKGEALSGNHTESVVIRHKKLLELYNQSSPEEQTAMLAIAWCARLVLRGECINSDEHNYSRADFLSVQS